MLSGLCLRLGVILGSGTLGATHLEATSAILRLLVLLLVGIGYRNGLSSTSCLPVRVVKMEESDGDIFGDVWLGVTMTKGW